MIPGVHRRIAAAVCLTLLLGACGKTPDELAHDQAVREARSKAVEAGARPLGKYDWRTDQIAHDVAQVLGVEVMRVTGTAKTDGVGMTVVIRAPGTGSTEKYGKPGTVRVRPGAASAAS